ncbi:MAG: redoxin domain-containing protein [Alphaproteobacteria bacterium]
MRYRILVLVLVLALGMMVSSAHANDIAPDFTAQDAAGHEHALAAYRGKIVVLEWNNPECPFVNKHYSSGKMQMLQQVARSHGIIWLAINSSAPGKQGYMTPAQAEVMVKQRKASVDGYILDPEGRIGRLYRATTTPHMFVIDKEGNLAYSGAIDDKPTTDPTDLKTAKNYVLAALDALVTGGVPEDKHIKAYGCSVKY